MKKNLIIPFLMLIVFFGATLMTAFTPFQGAKPWTVPDAAKSKKSSVASNAASIAAGKELWTTHCKSCHGAKGLGDGPKAASLKTSTGDFSTAKFQAQTDGELYYMSFVGRNDMPNFEKKILDEADRWAVIGYIRTMKK